MKLISQPVFVILLVAAWLTGPARAEETAYKYAKIATSKGDIIIELAVNEAPASTANFVEYALAGHYDRVLFHRVVKGFVIQGGGYSRYFNERVTRDPIPYEGDNGLKNLRGTIAMARTDDIDSAAAQWFINLKNNEDLDHFVNDLGPRYGYTVFGRVVDGMDIADAIGDVETGPGGPFEAEVPVDPVLILRVDPLSEYSTAESGGSDQ
ncbi:MAG: peptidylprolyl isomerase [Pseudomonadota bacterium]